MTYSSPLIASYLKWQYASRMVGIETTRAKQLQKELDEICLKIVELDIELIGLNR